ncbi:MAG TPA: tetratricopeptide repeat protein, partial [Bacteroidales bacterium]|nr:tetratricopeptide repeat protein [Bacteroidales bacterium]
MQNLKQHISLFIFLFFVITNGVTGQRTIINTAKADSLLIVSKQNALESKYLNQLSQYYFSHNPDSASLFASKALEQAQISDNISEIGYAYKNLGNCQFHLGNSDSAVYYYALAEKHFRKINHKEGLVALYNNIGVIHKTLNQSDLALKYFQKVRALMDKTKVD